MDQRQIFYTYIGSNVAALIMLALSWFWKTAGRLLLVLVFLWAGLYNFRTAIVRPEEFVSFARISYSSFFFKFFLQHTTGIVVTIAVGQLAIGILVSLRGLPVKIGLWGAALFLLAVAPLAAVGISARIIMVFAALLLLRATYSSSLWSELGAMFRHHPSTGGAS